MVSILGGYSLGVLRSTFVDVDSPVRYVVRRRLLIIQREGKLIIALDLDVRSDDCDNRSFCTGRKRWELILVI